MDKITISICGDPQSKAVSSLQKLVKGLHFECQILPIAWSNYWTDIVHIALYRHGADVSIVPAGLVGDLAGMNALRPFTQREIEQVGGENAFQPSAWRSVVRSLDQQVFGLPYNVDPRLIFYWSDLLEQAGVDPETAFKTPEQMDSTMAQLQRKGVKAPWVLETANPQSVMHTIAPWLWAKGGDFVSPDSLRTRFHSPESRAGIEAYFRLFRFMPRESQPLWKESEQFFATRQTAATMGGVELRTNLLKRADVDPQIVQQQLRAALPPGQIPWVGGSNLVIWEHCLRPQLALQVVKLIISDMAQSDLSQEVASVPVLCDKVLAPPFTTDPILKMGVQALTRGRPPFPFFKVDGLVTIKLQEALNAISREVLANPGVDLDTLMTSTLEPLAERLDLTLSQLLEK